MPTLLQAALALVLLGGCATGESTPRGTRILFVGNSLTYTNDVPAIVEELARSAGQPVETATIAYPNYSLADHLAAGEAARRIGSEHWDFIVLQQGPSALPESRIELTASTRQFAALAEPRQARIGLFAVWPASDRRSAFDSVSMSYQAAATAVDGAFFPVGNAWQFAWERAPALALYGADGFHPAPLGSLLAALVIYRGIVQHPIGPLPPTITINGASLTLSTTQAAVLLAAVEEAYR
jgi:hypothetical protein